MSKRKKRICVIGLGHFGSELALSLRDSCEVLAIDRNEARVNQISDEVQRALVLDVRDESALASVVSEDIDEAVVSMGESLEATILCTLYLKRLGVPVVRVKALSDDHATILRQLGADEVIFPEKETARRVAANIENPNLLDFLPLGEDHQVIETRLPRAFEGRSLKELDLRARHGVFVIAVKRAQGKETVITPGPDFRFGPGDLLVMIGRERDLRGVQQADS